MWAMSVSHVNVVKLCVHHISVKFVWTGLWERLWLLGLDLMWDTDLNGFLCMLHVFFLWSDDHFGLFLCSLSPEWHGCWDHGTWIIKRTDRYQYLKGCWGFLVHFVWKYFKNTWRKTDYLVYVVPYCCLACVMPLTQLTWKWWFKNELSI